MLSAEVGEACVLGGFNKSAVSHCMDCKAAFGFFRWRHSCKMCCRVICDGCSSYQAVTQLRVCGACSRDEAANPALLCPILHVTMTDPVIAQDGHSYERTAIEEWFGRSMKSPMTGAELSSTSLVPNHTLRQLIDAGTRGA